MFDLEVGQSSFDGTRPWSDGITVLLLPAYPTDKKVISKQSEQQWAGKWNHSKRSKTQTV